MNKPINFGLIGGGWRAEFFFRIAQTLPERFRVVGCVTRNEARRERIKSNWNIPLFTEIDELLKQAADFVVTSVPWVASGPLLLELALRNVPVLAETPPAADVAALIHLHQNLPGNARIQVAEQYAFQPLHAARLAFVRSGKLGVVNEVQVSIAHGYHGVSLIRKFLDVGLDNPVIRGFEFKSPLIAGRDRSGPPAEERQKVSLQTIAYLHFGEKLGIFDFTEDQYFSWVRSHRLLVRGDRGEINNLDAYYLEDFRTPVTIRFERSDAGQTGNLEGHHHKGYLAGGKFWYRNSFAPGRLMDDEIAIATSLQSMARYLETGEPFYGLAEASQDHYLALSIAEAAKTGKTVEATRQVWG
jgi:predicted dehydrogenase